MKNLLLSLLTISLVSFGLVATIQTAQASDPYPGSIATNCRVKVDRNSGKAKKTRVLAQVEVPSSKVKPKGKFIIKVTKKGKGVVFKKTLTNYRGKLVKYTPPKANKGKGKYVGNVRFIAKSGSVFKNCAKTRTFKVR
ncbi:hypothetical protein [Nocardioides sp.]|uniref:hypothetical protein n=1 Tax=Nocardioides sp. TaxID=35761 RepID=UPI0035684522